MRYLLFAFINDKSSGGVNDLLIAMNRLDDSSKYEQKIKSYFRTSVFDNDDLINLQLVDNKLDLVCSVILTAREVFQLRESDTFINYLVEKLLDSMKLNNVSILITGLENKFKN